MTRMDNLTWKEISRELDYKKYSRKIEKVVFKLPDGGESDFYIKNEGPTVCTLAITADQKVILFEQFRPGPKKVLRELPGGYMEGDEKPEEAATRELLEETGYSGNLKFVTTCLDDAYSTMVRYCCVATECQKTAEPNLDKNEAGNLIFVTIPEFRNLLRSGEMTDVEVGYICLDALDLL